MPEAIHTFNISNKNDSGNIRIKSIHTSSTMLVAIRTHEVRDAHNKNIRYDDECYRDVFYFVADHTNDNMDKDTYEQACIKYIDTVYLEMLNGALDYLDKLGGTLINHCNNEDRRIAFVRYIVGGESVIYDKIELVEADEVIVQELE